MDRTFIRRKKILVRLTTRSQRTNGNAMPSRKKARGRQKRAKKEATRTVEQRSLWEPTVVAAGGTVPCEHMLAVLPRIPPEGPAISLMNCLAGEGFFNKATRYTGTTELCFRLAVRFPEVREEDNERALAIDLLLAFVHDSAVEGESWFHKSHYNQVAICCMIYLLELLGTYSDLSVVRRRAAKTGNNLIDGNRRDIVKFVAKRLPCTCLKELHHAVRKKVAKVGTCFGCKEKFPRSQLHVCTGCRYTIYCSRECQWAHWPHHKQYCGNRLCLVESCF